MFPQKNPNGASPCSETYPLGEKSELSDNDNTLALVALSHTPVEHRLYCAMLSARKETPGNNTFTARSLMTLTGIRSASTVRRGLEGLLVKGSIEKNGHKNGNNRREQAHAYCCYFPHEVISRRQEAGGAALTPHVLGSNTGNGNHTFDRAIARVAENGMLSRREAQVALCCVEGLTNAQIGKRLSVSEQTVKFHLRHIFVKFSVKRRAELISRLLM
jgi:DNA-binding CsgD family transcriptional regulator